MRPSLSRQTHSAEYLGLVTNPSSNQLRLTKLNFARRRTAAETGTQLYPFKSCLSTFSFYKNSIKTWAKLSATTASKGPSESNNRKKVVLAFLRKILFFPLASTIEQITQYIYLRKSNFLFLFLQRLLILKPLKWLVGNAIDDLDGDGTVNVVEPCVDGDITMKSPYTFSASVITPYPPAPAGEYSAARQSKDEMLDPSEGSKLPFIVGTEAVEKASEAQSSSAVVDNSMPVVVDNLNETSGSSKSSAQLGQLPYGDRWAVAAPGIDLTGHWELIVTDDFRRDYDAYLAALGQPILVRTVALGIVGMTTEETKQTDDGKSLLIRGKNARGTWDRTLVASGATPGEDHYVPLHVPIMTADSEQVEAEAWWTDEGRVHVSWLRGVTKYGGGEFESRRYLEDDGNLYVCETTFHRRDKSKDPARITWRFRRHDGTGVHSA